jgi:hypothetical protein
MVQISVVQNQHDFVEVFSHFGRPNLDALSFGRPAAEGFSPKLPHGHWIGPLT